MEKKVVEMAQFVVEEIDGKEYKGYISFNNRKLCWNLFMAIPISELITFDGELNSIEEIRNVYKIFFTTEDNSLVELDNKEFGLVFQPIIEHVIEYYQGCHYVEGFVLSDPFTEENIELSSNSVQILENKLGSLYL